MLLREFKELFKSHSQNSNVSIKFYKKKKEKKLKVILVEMRSENWFKEILKICSNRKRTGNERMKNEKENIEFDNNKIIKISKRKYFHSDQLSCKYFWINKQFFNLKSNNSQKHSKASP